MKPIASHRTMSMHKMIFLLVLLFFLIDGCSKDSNPTGPFDPRPQNISGHWTGTAAENWYNGASATYLIDARFTQTADSVLDGNWLWTANTGERTRSTFKGTITASGNITIVETSFTAENWSGVGWASLTFKAVLSTDNKISCSYSFPGGGGGTGSFLLTKAAS